MDISNSSSDEENPVVTKKASFKLAVEVSYCSLVLEFIIPFFLFRELKKIRNVRNLKKKH